MLFEVKKLEKNECVTGDAAVLDSSAHVTPGSLKLQDVINLVDHGRTIHWCSAGDWSAHQLFEKLIELTGPAEVWISSYAFSELPARRLADMVNTGVITKLHCVIDSRIDVRSASAFSLIQNISTRFKLTDTHAKVTVISNKSWYLVVVGSANYTTNKRYEAGMITTDSAVVSFHLKWIENELIK